ncbi:tail fiber protein [Acetobacter cibinongensis]|nr:tail fiber protein [Acetobacter cibinongensis]GBQ19609.1 hypothetical protein AA0482_2612 [Acetobacter cibinongensis NRIC 0482]
MSIGSFDNTQKTIVLRQVIVVNDIDPATGNSSVMPLGIIRSFAFDHFLTPDTLSSEGQLLYLSDNLRLFSLLLTAYGKHDAGNFALPDFSGKVAIGAQPYTATSYTDIGHTTGENATTLTQAQLPPALGGTSQSIDNAQPSLSVNYLIRVKHAPSAGGFMGEVVAFAGLEPTMAGDQFIPAQGQLLKIALFPELFSLLRTTYGGDGVATFALPDLRGRSIIGSSNTVSLGSIVGQKTVSLSDANAPVTDGGQGSSFDNRAPGLALNYIICIDGAPPYSASKGQAVIGEVRAYAGVASTIPQGWVLANGALLSISDHTHLFALLGITYGGDGRSNFALPNLSDTVIAGSGGSQVFGETYGKNSVTLQVSDAACFCKGSLIRTSKGDTPIEDIQIGDVVAVYYDNTINGAVRRVTWVGYSHTVVRSHLPDDQAGYPVRLLKDAIAGGIPYKDMLITPEHCLFLDGQFVPVRMLVNGRSIFFDKSITSYTYYHIETEKHSVIMADGVMTESYLDTGNRSAFRQNGSVVSIGAHRHLSWEEAAAPLNTSRFFVEPLFQKLTSRAETLDHAYQPCEQRLTDNTGLHLVTQTGSILYPIRKENDRTLFIIPTGIETVQIVSRASRPYDTIGPFMDDRRVLGVLVGAVQLFEGHATKTVTLHLNDANLSGWNNVEDGMMRWTNGNALLPLGPRPVNAIAIMALQIHSAGPYLASDAQPDLTALQA